MAPLKTGRACSLVRRFASNTAGVCIASKLHSDINSTYTPRRIAISARSGRQSALFAPPPGFLIRGLSLRLHFVQGGADKEASYRLDVCLFLDETDKIGRTGSRRGWRTYSSLNRVTLGGRWARVVVVVVKATERCATSNSWRRGFVASPWRHRRRYVAVHLCHAVPRRYDSADRHVTIADVPAQDR